MSDRTWGAELAVTWLRMAAASVHERREWLTELDAAIGDGDHGINLDRGLTLIVSRLDDRSLPDEHPGPLLSAAGRLVLGTVGGASGALYGRALMQAGASITGGASMTAGGSMTAGAPMNAGAPGIDAGIGGHDGTGARSVGAIEREGAVDSIVDVDRRRLQIVAGALTAATEAIGSLGRSSAGEKTMLDALLPAARSLHGAVAAGVPFVEGLCAAAEEAAEGSRLTIPMLATKGRASYLGQRSIGHLDPGAASATLLLAALATAASELEAERVGG